MHLPTDALPEHPAGDVNYFPDRLEDVLRRVKHQSAREIHGAILADLLSFAPPADDVSFVVVKKLI